MSDVQLGVGSVAAWKGHAPVGPTTRLAGGEGTGTLKRRAGSIPAYASHVPSEERRAVTADVAGTSEALPLYAVPQRETLVERSGAAWIGHAMASYASGDRRDYPGQPSPKGCDKASHGTGNEQVQVLPSQSPKSGKVGIKSGRRSSELT